MKYLALIAAAGSLAAFSAPAQAAELPINPASAGVFAAFGDSGSSIAPAVAYDRDRWDDRRDWRGRGRDHDDRRWRGRDRDRDDRGYRGHYWRGDDGRAYCRRGDGTTGLLVGAGVGALLGRTVDTRGDRTVGTLLGAIGGGLLGREIDRGDVRCR